MHSEGILNRQSLAIKESWQPGFHFSHKRNRPEPQDARGNPMLLAEKRKKYSIIIYDTKIAHHSNMVPND